MFALVLEFSKDRARHYFALNADNGDNFLSPHSARTWIMPEAEHFDSYIKAIQEVLKMGVLSEINQWHDDRFEMQFSEVQGDTSLDYTHRLREVFPVALDLYTFKLSNPAVKVVFTLQEVKFKPHRTIPV